MENVFDVLSDRGFIKQTTGDEEIREQFANKKITFYIGFDPTADSLHIGHLLQIIVIRHMMNHGHKPILLIGGGTAKVGDPSGRTDMRSMMSDEIIMENSEKFARLFEKYIDFNKAKVVNNADWLLKLNYIDFLRDIGKSFSVNKMLAAECFKSRLEKGLSFLEFNYMLMQAYDFLMLFEKYNCNVQLGGNDQWSNILAGVDLIRRVKSNKAYGMTFTLLETKDGVKMGKTMNGALWLDENKTSAYEFFQYFRNINDVDVENCLNLLTFLPLDEIKELLKGDINKAKISLGYEVTKFVHGKEKASEALSAAEALFSNGNDLNNVPKTELNIKEIVQGIGLAALMTKTSLTKSNGEAMRAIEQGGVSINNEKVSDKRIIINKKSFDNGKLLIKKGKKNFHMVELKE
ncbi:MAG: tyrosine--tRNA ligase [Clostridiales Family XIII bacterium]|jgi:tyrosyl-tRNA synthetase|nr:tyrosine--tRNA ligase [Clostridiales Family XIII bacterium]